MLLYKSKLHLSPGKLKSRWTGPFTIQEVYLNGSVDLLNSKDDKVFKVNWQRLKLYEAQHSVDKEEIPLLDPHEFERLPEWECLLQYLRSH